MIPALLAVGVVYLLLRDGKGVEDPQTPEDPEPDVPQPPRPAPDQYDGMARETIEKVWSGDNVAVFKVGFLMGVLYDNGTDERYYDYSFVVGNPEGTGFTSANSDRGTRTVQGQPRVLVYATKRDAIEAAEKPKDDDGPMKPPEDDERPSTPNPLLPPIGGGLSTGGSTNLSSGIGGY